jgi:hypothetical protein
LASFQGTFSIITKEWSQLSTDLPVAVACSVPSTKWRITVHDLERKTTVSVKIRIQLKFGLKISAVE